MQSHPKFVFHDSEEYAFLFENAHLLLVTWKRDDTNFLFLIRGQTPEGDLQLSYPGATFIETVLDAVLPIFFVQVDEEGTDSVKHYILGSYFLVGSQRYGAYYERERQSAVVLFRIQGESPDLQLEVPDDAEYLAASRVFQEQHQDFMQVQSDRGTESDN